MVIGLGGLMNTAQTDQDRVRSLKQDDPQAVKQLWELLYIRGKNLARRYRQEPDMGSEAAIAAYLRIRTRGVYQFRFACPFEAYCQTILVREMLRLIKKNSPHGMTEEEWQHKMLGALAELPTFVDAAALGRLLKPCLEQLSVRAQKVLALRYEEEQEPQVVADDLGLKRNYVNQIAFTARRRVRDCLQRRGYQSINDML
jgi:RNA polymerase sigma factor (sigma-70 family)